MNIIKINLLNQIERKFIQICIQLLAKLNYLSFRYYFINNKFYKNTHQQNLDVISNVKSIQTVMQTNSAFHIPQTKQALKSRGIAGNADMWIKQMAERDTKLWGMPKPLWIIDNKMYDLTQWASKHPGGRSWIDLTKGHDITALFRTHHLQYEKVKDMLEKYYVGPCPIQHPSRFQFDSEGSHFEALRKRILNKFTVKQLQNTTMTQIRCVILLIIWFVLMALASYYQSYVLAIVAGYWGMTNWATGHLFGHVRDTHILRHTFLFIGFTAKQQQIQHSISHHPYTNTMLDYQYAAIQPLICFARVFPKNKWYSPISYEIIFMTINIGNVFSKLIAIPLKTKTMPDFQYAIIFLQIIFMYIFCRDWSMAIKLFIVMVLSNGFFIGKMLLCPHRQTQLWSQGSPQIRDYVLHNIASTTDFSHKATSYESLLLYSGFNVHIIHHLFPTIDHNKLPECNKIFMEYCQEKGMKVMVNGLYECNKGLFKILMKKIPFTLKLFVRD